MSLDVGESFTLTNRFGKHLHFVVAEDSPSDTGHILLVYITTSTSVIDTTTVLNIGDHAFINERSWVKYSSADIFERPNVLPMIQERYGKITSELLNRLQRGVMDSERCPNRVKTRFVEWQQEVAFRHIHELGK